MAHVIGVDGCRGGWCAVSIQDEKDGLNVSPPAIYPSFQEVLASPAELICIDVPIGLLDGPGQRQCDVEARALLGWPRRNAVFPTPCRAAFPFRDDYPAASAANFKATGRKLNKQTFNIMPKIAEVDGLITPALQESVREVHPEVCFWAVNGQAMAWNKKKPPGRDERWSLLRIALPMLPAKPSLPPALRRACAIDDYIDAIVAAWTAGCIIRRSADRIPSEPELDNRGLRMQMWFPAV